MHTDTAYALVRMYAFTVLSILCIRPVHSLHINVCILSVTYDSEALGLLSLACQTHTDTHVRLWHRCILLHTWRLPSIHYNYHHTFSKHGSCCSRDTARVMRPWHQTPSSNLQTLILHTTLRILLLPAHLNWVLALQQAHILPLQQRVLTRLHRFRYFAC